jgi:hypothetical protein
MILPNLARLTPDRAPEALQSPEGVVHAGLVCRRRINTEASYDFLLSNMPLISCACMTAAVCILTKVSSFSPSFFDGFKATAALKNERSSSQQQPQSAYLLSLLTTLSVPCTRRSSLSRSLSLPLSLSFSLSLSLSLFSNVASAVAAWLGINVRRTDR